jgi:RNA polymerase sigma-70 factor (ECF subfamily)
MSGRAQSGEEVRPVVYCLVPRDLAPRLHEQLRRHFAGDPSVEVVVERRRFERRGGRDRRGAQGNAAASTHDHRRIRAAAGRRLGARRAVAVPVEPPPLPRRARAHAERLVFVERVEPSGREAEDVDTARVVAAVQAGDGDAFAVLYMRYFDRVYSYLRLLFRSRDGAEEAAQDVFVKALEAIRGYEAGPRSFRAWLFVVARNHALNELGRHSRTRTTSLDAADWTRLAEAQPEPLIGPQLEWISDSDLQLLIGRLPLAQRQALFLRYVVDLSTSETALVLDTTAVAVRHHHARALAFLRARLAALGRDSCRREGRVPCQVVLRGLPVLRARRFSLR